MAPWQPPWYGDSLPERELDQNPNQSQPPPSTPPPPPPRISGFTPINVDSEGRRLSPPVIDNTNLEPPSKRQQAQDRNPWTPRKAVARRSRQFGSPVPLKKSRISKARERLGAVNVSTVHEVETVAGRPDVMTSTKLRKYLYAPDAIENQAAGKESDHVAITSEESSSTRIAPQTTLPKSDLQQTRERSQEYHSAIGSEQSKPSHLCSDLSPLSPGGKLLVPATPDLIVRQTPPRKARPISIGSPSSDRPGQRSSEEADRGLAPFARSGQATSTRCSNCPDGVEYADADNLIDANPEFMVIDEPVRDGIQGTPTAVDKTLDKPVKLDQRGMGPGLSYHSESMFAQNPCNSASRNVYRDFDTRNKRPHESKPSSAPIHSSPADDTMFEALDTSDEAFGKSAPPSTPSPCEPPTTLGMIALNDHDGDFLDDLDEQDAFDLIDAANQVSAALESKSSSSKEPASLSRPKLLWNPPKEFNNLQKRQEHSKLPPSTEVYHGSSAKSRHSDALVSDDVQHDVCNTISPKQAFNDASGQASPKSSTLSAPTTLESTVPAPFMRGKFPKMVKDRSPISGLSSTPCLRVCFRIGEMLNEVKSSADENRIILVELYARINSVQEVPGELIFTLSDLFYPQRPPFLNSMWRGWRTNEYWITDAQALKVGVICRALGKVQKELVGGRWIMDILSAQQVCWEDVEFVRGIVCAK